MKMTVAKATVKSTLRKGVLISGMLALLSVASVAQAEGKYAVVNVQAALQQSDEAKRWIKKFEAQNAKERNQLKALESELKKLQDRFKKDEAVMSAEQKRKSSQEMQEKFEEFQFKRKKYQSKFAEGQQQLLKDMLPKVQEAMKKLVEKDGYDIVFHREAAAMAKDKYDLTKDLIKQLNR